MTMNYSIHGLLKMKKPWKIPTMSLENPFLKHHLQKNGPSTASLTGHTDHGALHVSWADQKNDPHKRNQTRESEMPIIFIDYSFLTDEESLQSMPTLNMIDRHTNYFHCEIVPRKGADQYAATTLRTFLENTGYTKLVLKSDQESSILALIGMVKTQTRIKIVSE